MEVDTPLRKRAWSRLNQFGTAASATLQNAIAAVTPKKEDEVEAKGEAALPGGAVPAGRGFRRFSKKLEKWAPFRWMEEKSGIHKVYIAFVLVVLASAITIPLMGVDRFAATVAFVYPAYQSYKTLKTDNEENHMHWLTYWVVYGMFDLVDEIVDFFLYWLPYYQLLKIIFLFWLFWPRTKGCQVLYELVVQPLFQSNSETIDQGLVLTQEKMSQISGEVTSMSTELVATVAQNVIRGIALTGMSKPKPTVAIEDDDDGDAPRRRR